MAEGPKRAPGRNEAVPSNGQPRITAVLSGKEALAEINVVSMIGSFNGAPRINPKGRWRPRPPQPSSLYIRRRSTSTLFSPAQLPDGGEPGTAPFPLFRGDPRALILNQVAEPSPMSNLFPAQFFPSLNIKRKLFSNLSDTIERKLFNKLNTTNYNAPFGFVKCFFTKS